MPATRSPRPLLPALSATVAVLAALTSPALARRAIAPLPTDPPKPGPEVAVATKLARGWLGKLEVRAPRVHKGLKIFPLATRPHFRLGDYLTLDEALKSKALKVTELEGGAQVNELRLENTGTKPVFIMGGEIMRGAKQDRTLQGDVVVPPKSGVLTVRAFCTEQGRWNEQSSSFQAADAAVPNSVRGVAKGEKVQGRVWDSIAENQSKLRVSAPTSAAKEVYQDKKVQADVRPYLDAFEDLPRRTRDMVGMAVTYGDRLVAVDVFGDGTLASRLYPKLLRSYVVDVVADAWRGDRDEAEVRTILTTAHEAAWKAGVTDGVGTALEFSAGGMHGTCLVEGGAVIHADIFEGAAAPAQAPGMIDRRNRSREPNVAPNRAPNLPIEQQQQQQQQRQVAPSR